ncbi:hypothetical protein DTL42_12510 [Bremerella cremea]|uniref:Uncharacterized protein n=1 Tax=Bremerella cremea TaxID=1031537 RepID=A0A368KR34_9BACT|nr:hypothetical protein [Bremerella cremea]RCS49348.1 hypothetical protein DTL42_12510 [Bremerella cremea]
MTSLRHDFVFRLLLLVLLAWVVPGCQPQSEELTHAKRLLRISQGLTKSGERTGVVTQPWFQGQKIDLAELDQALAKGKQDILQVRKEFELVSVPDTPKSRHFSKLVGEYIDWQIDVALPAFQEVADLIKQENPASPATRQHVMELLITMNDNERARKREINAQARAMGASIQH